jgi:hypothetical protein
VTTGPSPHLAWSELHCWNRLTVAGKPAPFQGIPPGGLVAVYPLDLRATVGIRVGATFEAIRASVGVRLGGGVGIRLGSAYRTPDYDRAIGGTSNRHPKGDAIDLWTPKGLTGAEFHALIWHLAEHEIAEIGAIGRYAWGCHVDHRPRVRGRIARWDG